jgi:hypothetical protein
MKKSDGSVVPTRSSSSLFTLYALQIKKSQPTTLTRQTSGERNYKDSINKNHEEDENESKPKKA